MNFELLFEKLEYFYITEETPVKKFEALSLQTPLLILLSAMLSSRTNDKVTTKIITKLKIHKIEDLKKINENELAKQLYPIGFYKQKARQICLWYNILKDKKDLPKNRDKIMLLPGVGRKTANLFLSRAFGLPYICVDIHVFRISNRLGIVSSSTTHKTEKSLEQILPKKYYSQINRYFVALGQTICRPRTPKCTICPVRNLCKRINL